MTKFYLIFIAFILINCQSSKSTSSQSIENEPEMVFSLESTSCMGKCPVYKLAIKSDLTISFEGIENTSISGVKTKVLSQEEYDEIIGLINQVSWSKLKSRYESKMSDLPSFSFVYNSEDSSYKVFQYGPDPEDLTVMRKSLISKIDNAEFFN